MLAQNVFPHQKCSSLYGTPAIKIHALCCHVSPPQCRMCWAWTGQEGQDRTAPLRGAVWRSALASQCRLVCLCALRRSACLSTLPFLVVLYMFPRNTRQHTPRRLQTPPFLPFCHTARLDGSGCCHCMWHHVLASLYKGC